MLDVQKSLQDYHIIKYAYGCSAHCDNNLTLGFCKQGKFPDTIKKAFYIIKTVKNVGTMRKIYENVYKERLGKVLGNYMFKLLLNVRSVCLGIIHVLQGERSKRGIDLDFQLPSHAKKTFPIN